MVIAITFAIACVVALIVTPLVRVIAHRYGLLDHPDEDERKIHQQPTPRLGGVAMAVGFGVAIGAATIGSPVLSDFGVLRTSHVPAILAGVGLLLVTGLVDDIRGMRAMAKLLLQFAAAIVAWLLGLRIEQFHLGSVTIDLGVFSLGVTVIWIVGVINAINLIDGLDGLAAGVALTVLGAFGLIAAVNRFDPTLPIIAATAGAAAGFLAYNLHPASIHMGDTGAMFLGFIVAAIGISLTQEGLYSRPPWVPLVALAVPLADMVWAVVRRTANGSSFFMADRGHIHHQLLRRGLSQRDAMLLLTAISGAFALVAVVLGRVR
jgi:UDP-GlcNAc:undecaprenyl-phosphate GlcNAc-1-phosphate transferase